MIDFEKHLKFLTIVGRILSVIMTLNIIILFIGLAGYLPRNFFQVFIFVSVIISAIFALYIILSFYLGYFQGIHFSKGKFVVNSNKKRKFIFIIYLVIGLLALIFLIYFFIWLNLRIG